MTTDRFDTLVVGARCAGAATSMLMARQGMRVLAIDRGGYGTDTTSTHALMRGGVLQLHRWGVLPRLQAFATPAIRRTVFHYGNETLEIAVRAANGVEALYAPRRTVLDRLLVDAALEAGADIRHGHALAGLLRRSNGRVAGAVVRDDSGKTFEVAADLVIGADGAGSAVARGVSALNWYEARHTTTVIYGYWHELRVEPAYHWYYALGARSLEAEASESVNRALKPVRDRLQTCSGAAAGVIPTNSGMHCVFVAVPPERFRTHLRQDLAAGYRQVLGEVSPGLAEAVAEANPADGGLRVFAGRNGFLRSPHGPGWALVGDAGYFRDPITAHGITDALRDAELLADAAVQDTSAAFARYAAIRESLSLPLFHATDAIASFQWDFAALQAHHQVLNLAMKREVAYLETLVAPAPTGRPLASLGRASTDWCSTHFHTTQKEMVA